jgi:GDP-L-fucose synthase
MDKQAKIFVAGHRGLVGSAIARALESRGYSNLVVRSHAELDLTDQAAVDGFFEKENIEYVFLAAAKVGGINANMTYPANFIQNNLMIQCNVIDSAYRHGIKKLLFLGSSCIYPKMAPQPMKEEYLLTGPLEPTNQWYAIAKIAGIKMCQAYREQYGFNAISVMPTNLYGPWDNFNLENSHVLPAMIRKLHLAKLASLKDSKAIERDEERFGPIVDEFRRNLKEIMQSGPDNANVVLWGTGKPKREFLYVDDLADACVFLMQHYDSGEIVNIGVGEDLSVKELAEMIQKVVGFNGNIRYDRSKPDGTPRKLLDVSRIFSFGWRPKTSLSDGIRRTYDWYIKRS